MKSSNLAALAVMLVFVGGAEAWAQGSECKSMHQPFVEDGIAEGRMLVLNNGKGCDFAFKFGATGSQTSWKVDEAPKHGRLDASGSKVTYLPEPGYAGPDKFVVSAYGLNPYARGPNRTRNGQFAVTVEVRTTP